MFHQAANLAGLSREEKDRKILITGASGFIGSHLVDEALRLGYTVYAGVRAGSKRDFLQQDLLQFFSLDLSSPLKLKDQLTRFASREGGFDYIIHNAGITRADRKEEFQLVNDTYTRHLVKAISESGCMPLKFVFISSLAAGGPGDPLHFKPIDIADADHPLSAYAKSKLSAERYIQSQEGLPYIIIRPTAVYGPRDKDFLTLFRLINKGVEPVIGRHPQKISLLYVKDLARFVCQLMESGDVRTSWLLSDGVAYDKEDLGGTLRSVLGKKVTTITIPLAPVHGYFFCMEKVFSLFHRMPFFHPDKLREMAASNWLCDSDAAWAAAGIKPLYTLEAAVRETARWYEANGWIR